MMFDYPSLHLEVFGNNTTQSLQMVMNRHEPGLIRGHENVISALVPL